MSDFVDTAAAREAMIAKRFGGQSDVRTGGKGSVRRKKKTVHKTATNGKHGFCAFPALFRAFGRCKTAVFLVALVDLRN